MARHKRDAKLDSRNARLKIPERREPYWCALSAGLALGYRKGSTGGHWVAKHYSATTGRRYHAIGPADDTLDAGAISFDQAQAKAREWLGTAPGDAPRGPYTVNRALDDYIDYLRSAGRADSAIKDASYRIEAFIRPTLGMFEVAALKPDQLRRWRADLAKAAPRLRTISKEKQKYRKTGDDRARKATANRILTTLKAALNHAFDEERVSSNKAWGRRVKPFEDVEMARVRYLQIGEAKRLVNNCDTVFRPMVEAALQTGSRYSELARLKVVDFDRGTVFIQLSKSGKARHVVLSDEGVKFFRRACAGRAGDELIFRKNDGGPWLKSHQARPMADACKRAKIKPSIGFHGLRHTWASHAVMNGVPLLIVAKNLGHSDTRMVEKHYGHMSQEHVADAIRAGAPKFGFEPDRKVVAIDDRA